MRSKLFMVIKILINPVTGKRLDPLDDFFFKKIFGEESCKNLLVYFVNAIFDEFGDKKISKVKYIQNPTIPAENKYHISDIHFETEHYIIHMESQIQKQEYFSKGIGTFSDFAGNEQIQNGQDGHELKEVMEIIVLGHKIQDVPTYHDQGVFTMKKFPKSKLFENTFKTHVIQVPRIEETEVDLNNELHRWLILLYKNSNEELFKKVIEMDKNIHQAYNILKHTTKNDEEMAIYEMNLKATHDYNSGINHGKRKGIEEGKKEVMIITASKMKKEGFDPEKISKITGLSLNEIKNI
jgi:predicted transposase/invertase (TIGR01784 family)